MKRIIFSMLVVVLTSSIALADWKETFETDYTTDGLNTAVVNALGQGIAPDDIIEAAMALGTNGQVLATTMCDGGVPVQALQDSLSILGISMQMAVKSCGGGEGNIVTTGAFPGSTYSSAGQGTTSNGAGLGAGNGGLPTGPGPGAPPVVIPPTPGRPASGSNF